MTLLGHKTDIMFGKYIQRFDQRLIEAAKALADHRLANLANTGNRNSNGHNSVAESHLSVKRETKESE
jgi:hypothetical protein